MMNIQFEVEQTKLSHLQQFNLISFQMSLRFDNFIQTISQESAKIPSILAKIGLDFQSYYQCLPPHVFDSLWISSLQSQGFYSALNYIKSSIDTYIFRNNKTKDSNQQKKQHDYITNVICPLLITYKSHNCSTQQIMNRANELKKIWKLSSNICSYLIPFIEYGEQKQNEPQSKKHKIINDLLVIFDTNQSKLDYKAYGLQLLNQSILQVIYELKNFHLNYQQIYKKLCFSNRQKIIHFFAKIKKKENTCASILSQIVCPQNNKTTNRKIKNICLLFLFTQSWDRFKQNDSKLKEGVVIQIISEAFGRLLYLTYDNEASIVMVFLNFLTLAKFTLYDQIKQTIAHHLISLYKFNRYTQKNTVAKLIENLWLQKMKGAKLNQIYIQYLPNCKQSQKGQEKSLQGAQTKSMKSRNSSQKFSLISNTNRTSKSKQSRMTRNNTLHKRIKQIQEELRRCNLERIYILMGSLKQYYFTEYEQRKIEQPSRNIVLGLVIALIKKIQAKIKYRYKCSLLKKCIYLQIMQLKERCYQGSNFQFNEKNQILGLFQCCYLDKAEINLQAFMKFHQKNNYQQNLQTVYTLKTLYQDLNSNQISGSKLQFYEDQLGGQGFQGMVYQLYKTQINQSKKMDIKRLSIICRLLLLKSQNITNDLLVNYVYSLLKKDKGNQNIFSRKVQALSKLINQEIHSKQNQQRIKLLLKMGEVFQQFQHRINEQSFKLQCHVGNRYFQFLRRKQHAPYYFQYSQIYLSINYLKQSLYFLQLHQFMQKKRNTDVTIKAIQIYQRLNNPFKTNLASILQQLEIDASLMNMDRQSQKQSNKTNFQSILCHFLKRMELQFKLSNYDQLYMLDNPRIQLWLNFYYPYLQIFIHEMEQFKQSQQINQSLRKYNILLKYINLKIDLIKEPNILITYNRLTSIISHIQKLTNYQDRNHLYQHFLSILNNNNQVQYLENIFLQNMLEHKHYEELLKYLRRNLSQFQTNANMPTNYLSFLIKYHFQRSQFDKCLSMIKVLQQRKQRISNLTEIYHMQLQCRHNIMLNYTIEEYLTLINKCIVSSSKDITNQNKQHHFKYYFKIYRMLFNRYNFTSINHNQMFLQTYFNFIDCNSILTENLEYIGETIFYLLRFLVEKFDYSIVQQYKPFEKAILQKFKGKLDHFVSFCNYLIKRISFNTNKNQVIKIILKTIITEHPRQCIWTISFLRNFAMRTPKNLRLSSQQNNQMQKLGQIYKEVIETLQAKKTLNIQHLTWIDNLVKLSFCEAQQKKQKSNEFKQIPIPPQLLFMFNPNFYINRIQDIRVLSNGKSAPLQMIFNLINVKEKHYRTVKVIIKANVGSKKYRMQSNTANFFEEIGLIDKDITYKIIHLSKYLVSIEHRVNCGTINSIITQNLPDCKKMENAILMELQKRRQNSSERRLLQIYDRIDRTQTKVKFSQIIFYRAKNIKDWWKKYSNFVRTHAQWSYLGYIVGLGDRHCDNILITEQAKLIHIDFQYALDTGLKLPCPQWVPFRLTTCFVEPLGILGVFGMYYAEMIDTVKQFEQKQHNIWRALSHFVGSMDTNVCQQIIKRSKFINLNVKSLEEGAAKIISSSKDPQLLRLMFQGWRAYL